MKRKLDSEAWGIVTPDGHLCRNLVRDSAKKVMAAHAEMFPDMSPTLARELGYKVRKLHITFNK